MQEMETLVFGVDDSVEKNTTSLPNDKRELKTKGILIAAWPMFAQRFAHL